MNFLIGVINSAVASILLTIGFHLASWSNLIPQFSLNTGFFGTLIGVFGYVLVLVSFIELIKYTLSDN